MGTQTQTTDVMTKVHLMLTGEAVLLTVDELDAIEAEGWNVRTAHNADAIGTRSAPYVGWMSGSLSTTPPAMRIHRDTMKASAKPGRCRWSSAGGTLPVGYRVPDEYARSL
jgi:hypothetical protein